MKRNCQGFTLMELLITLTILGSVSVSVGAFYSRHRASSRAIDVGRLMETDGRQIVHAIRQDLRQGSIVAAKKNLLTIKRGERVIRYHILNRQLEREVLGGSAPKTVWGRARSFEGKRSSDGTLKLNVKLSRQLEAIVKRREVSALIATTWHR